MSADVCERVCGLSYVYVGMAAICGLVGLPTAESGYRDHSRGSSELATMGRWRRTIKIYCPITTSIRFIRDRAAESRSSKLKLKTYFPHSRFRVSITRNGREGRRCQLILCDDNGIKLREKYTFNIERKGFRRDLVNGLGRKFICAVSAQIIKAIGHFCELKYPTLSHACDTSDWNTL